MPGASSEHRARLIVAAGFLCALLVFLWLAPIDVWLAGAEEWSRRRPVAAAALFLLFSTLAAVFFLPGSVIAMGAGYLYGLSIGAPLALGGLTAGAIAAFYSGRFLVRGWVSAWMETRPRLRALDKAVNERSFLIIALARLSVVMPFNLLNYAFGVTGAKGSAHAAATAVGMIPATLLWTYFGTLAKSLADIRAGRVESGLPSGYVLVLGSALLLVVVFVLHRTASRALADELGTDR